MSYSNNLAPMKCVFCQGTGFTQYGSCKDCFGTGYS